MSDTERPEAPSTEATPEAPAPETKQPKEQPIETYRAKGMPDVEVWKREGDFVLFSQGGGLRQQGRDVFFEGLLKSHHYAKVEPSDERA